MKKETFLKKYNLTEAQFEGKEPISGYLDLRSVTAIPEGFNPTVGGDLDLRSVTSIPEGFNPTVGGYLYWKNNSKRIGATVPEIKTPTIELSWHNGLYRKVDGIFCYVTHPHPHNVQGFEVYRMKKVNRDEFFFLAKSDTFYAHGKTIEKAIEDLRFKIMAEKVKKEPIKKDTIITRNHYRIITGACEFGVNDWMQKNGVTKEEITAGELLPLLEKTSAYGLDRFKSLVTF